MERMDQLAVAAIAWRQQTALRDRDTFDRGSARLALLDRIEPASAAERKPALAMFKTGRRLARQHQCDLPRLEVGNFNLSALHLDGGVLGIHRHAELGALHHSCEIGSFDLEMLHV